MLSEKVIESLEKEEINGHAFLMMSKANFLHCKLPVGPATRLANFAKECSEEKLKPFLSYRSLRDVASEIQHKLYGTKTIPLSPHKSETATSVSNTA